MSLRTSRRSQGAAAGGGGGFASAPSVPISEIRTRKWTKQVKTVGHLLLSKWVPDQEAPTALLQKGSFKKTKGRKRAAVEVGRMTRSVRQHLDAPLELLNEYPTLRKPAPAAPVVPAPAAPAAVAESVQPTVAMPTPAPQAPAAASIMDSASTAPIAPPAVDSASIQAIPMPASNVMDMTSNNDHMLAPPSNMYSSNEQLERDLDDLPFLDVEEMPMSVISGEQTQHPLDLQQQVPVAEVTFPGKTVAQPEEQKNDDDEDDVDGDSDSGSSGDEAGSNKSWSPLPSPSPNSSPVPSASPSP